MYVCSLRMLYLGSNKTFMGASTYIQPVLLPMHALYVLVTLTMEMSILIDWSDVEYVQGVHCKLYGSNTGHSVCMTCVCVCLYMQTVSVCCLLCDCPVCVGVFCFYQTIVCYTAWTKNSCPVTSCFIHDSLLVERIYFIAQSSTKGFLMFVVNDHF